VSILDPAGAVLERARALCEDLSLEAVRRWKAANPGGLAVGYLPVYAPRPLLESLGCLPVAIFGGGDQVDVVRGDSFFQSYICHLPRSTLDLALAGRFDALDAMIFPSTCDVIRNLGGMWRMLFPDRYATYLDLPQRFDGLGGRFYAAEMRRIARDLEARGARPLAGPNLRTAIARENDRRAVLAELDDLRRREPWRVRASEAYLLVRAGASLSAADHAELLCDFLAAAWQRPARAYDNVRVVVVGAFCEQPPLGLVRTLEKAGCDIVEDDFQLGLRTLEGPIEVSAGADPLDSLALAFLRQGRPTATRFLGEAEKGAALVERVRTCGADGVIFAAPSFCDPALLDQPMLERALDRAGIPHTAIKYAENSAQYQSIREQAGAFSDAVKLWGGAPVTPAKDASQIRQKRMFAEHYERLARARDEGRKVVYTFVPGNLTELLGALGLLPVLPEINALQSGMRGKSGDHIQRAEKAGHSEDVCSYVKCDVGMMLGGNVGPTGTRIPAPDLLLLSYTGCFVFLKWFELLREAYRCPVVMLHVPYQADGVITPEMRRYVVDQIREEVIPALERVAGKRLDEEELRGRLALSAKAEDDLVAVWESARRRPSPIDGYFGGVYYVGPIFSAFRGTEDAAAYYRELRAEVAARAAAGEGPPTPDGPSGSERYRLVVEGPPNWTSFHEFWRMFSREGAVAVASTYTRVGGLYDTGFRHDPERPLESLAEYALGCYTNLGLPARVSLLERYVRDYEADGLLVSSVKSCNSFSAGQLLMLREVERRTGTAVGFLESDLVDPRYFGRANIENRVQSFLQMLEARRRGGYA
jgi:benzoyl-CoA reductase subunit B